MRNHDGWRNGSKQTTLLAILSAMGTDCTLDFDEVHSNAAKAQLAAFKVGVLDCPNLERAYIRYRTWQELEQAGVV